MNESKLTKNAKKVLKERYLKKNEDGEIVETPEEMFERVARAVAEVNADYDDDRTVDEEKEEFEEALRELHFLPNSPTLMNAGLELGQLSACFVISPLDDMKSIFQQVENAAQIFQSGGGVGYTFSRLRPKGDTVKSTGGVASGPISFMRVYDEMCNTVKQGGRRRGAQMGVLSVQHPDIMDFITAKDEEGELENFNISVALTEEFMEAVENGEEYDLINPRNGEVTGTLDAREVYDKIVKQAWKNGEPGIMFLDRINKDNPFKLEEHPEHKIEATNPCVTGDTKVYTDSGMVEIREIVGEEADLMIDDRICDTNPNTTKRIFKTGVKEVFRLETKEGYSLRVTGDHEIKTTEGWKEAQELEDGDEIFLFSSGVGAFGDKGNEPIGRCLAYDVVKNPKQYRDENRNHIKGAIPTPKDVLKGTEEMQRGFIFQAFDERGTYEEDMQELSIRVENIEFLKDIQMLLLNFAIKSEVDDEEFKLSIQGENVSRFIEHICEGGNDLPESINGIEHDIEVQHQDAKPQFTATFDSLIEDGTEEVYDLTEPISHTFTANGLVISNCGEQPLEDFEACNLGHINLRYCVDDGEIDWDHLENMVDLGTRFLDNVIDASKFPNIEDHEGNENAIERKVKANRKIGLGVMGWHNMLMQLGIPYDSDEAIEKAHEVMGFIQEKSKEVSKRIAEKRGEFPNWDETEYDEPIRNATTTTIAPTGTTSMIANSSGGVEPIFAVSYIKNVLGGESMIMPDPIFEEYARDEGFYSEDLMEKIAKKGSVADLDEVPDDIKPLFKTALEISPEWHVRMQAAFQQHVDNAISKTVNFPNDATEENIKEVYDLAYELGCKGVTVFRSGSRTEQVMETEEKETDEEKEESKKEVRTPRERPEYIAGTTQKINTGYGNIYVTINEDDDGLFEVFAQIGSSGGFVQSFTEAVTRLTSICLRSNIPPKEVIDQLKGIRSPKTQIDKGTTIHSIPDAIGKAIKWHMEGKVPTVQSQLPVDNDGKEKENSGIDIPDMGEKDDIEQLVEEGFNPACPDCGEMMTMSEGCIKCNACGYSECG